MYDCRPIPEIPYGMFAAVIVGCVSVDDAFAATTTTAAADSVGIATAFLITTATITTAAVEVVVVLGSSTLRAVQTRRLLLRLSVTGRLI